MEGHTIGLSKEYSTHMAILVKALDMSSGPVIEMGGGLFSTPLLHWLCAYHKRKLITYEDSPLFFNFERLFISRNHKIRLVKNWDEVVVDGRCGVIFIDHDPYDGSDVFARRKKDALRLVNNADLLVLHDSDHVGYKDEEFWKQFKYVYNWDYAIPNTAIVSNFMEIK
jgi:hypothetical protein